MIGNYALTLYRSLARHRLFSVLSILGLAIGIAVFLVLWLTAQRELSYDRWLPDAERIYRIDRTVTLPGRDPRRSATTQAVMLPQLMLESPQIEAGARLFLDSVTVRHGDQARQERVIFADPSLFSVLQAPLVEGDPRDALASPQQLVISQAVARRYFGDGAARGRTLTLVINGEPRPYTVAAVLRDLPDNTHLDLPIVAPLSPSALAHKPFLFSGWGSSSVFTYVKLRPGADPADLDALLPAFLDRHAGGDVPSPASRVLKLELRPLSDIHFADAGGDEALRPGVELSLVMMIATIGVVVLLISAVNYVNLAAARASLRAREIAVRKAVGATQSMLIVQFLVESVLTTALAALAGLALIELLRPFISRLTGAPLVLAYLGPQSVTPLLLGVIVFIGMGAGLYPALLLSRIQPATVFATARAPGGGRANARFREALVAAQFSIAIVLAITVAVVFAQGQFLRRAELGFDAQNLIIVEGLNDEGVAPVRMRMLEAFRRTPGVVGVTISERGPGITDRWSQLAKRPGRDFEAAALTRETIGSDYFETYRVRLIAGRPLGPSNRIDDEGGLSEPEVVARGLNVVLSRRAVQVLGFASPQAAIGQPVSLASNAGAVHATVVGVAEDVKFLSLREAPAPVLYHLDSLWPAGRGVASGTAALRLRGDISASEALAGLERAWRSAAPGVPFRGEPARLKLAAYYEADARRGRIFALGAALAIGVACLGLYGLAAFTTARRTKEIGIRKALGASTGSVLLLLSYDFMRPVLAANLIAWPLAFILAREWLSEFTEHISLSPLYFVGASALALLIAFGTILAQAHQVARAEPARALRYE